MNIFHHLCRKNWAYLTGFYNFTWSKAQKMLKGVLSILFTQLILLSFQKLFERNLKANTLLTHHLSMEKCILKHLFLSDCSIPKFIIRIYKRQNSLNCHIWFSNRFCHTEFNISDIFSVSYDQKYLQWQKGIILGLLDALARTHNCRNIWKWKTMDWKSELNCFQDLKIII